MFTRGGTTGNAYVDGTQSSNADLTVTAGNLDVNQVGDANGFGDHEGTMQELIIFGSDQSSKRTLLENDINDYYGIY